MDGDHTESLIILGGKFDDMITSVPSAVCTKQSPYLTGRAISDKDDPLSIGRIDNRMQVGSY